MIIGEMKPIISKENAELNAAMLEIRRSNAATPHRNKKKYTRKQKHRKDAY